MNIKLARDIDVQRSLERGGEYVEERKGPKPTGYTPRKIGNERPFFSQDDSEVPPPVFTNIDKKEVSPVTPSPIAQAEPTSLIPVEEGPAPDINFPKTEVPAPVPVPAPVAEVAPVVQETAPPVISAPAGVAPEATVAPEEIETSVPPTVSTPSPSLEQGAIPIGRPKSKPGKEKAPSVDRPNFATLPTKEDPKGFKFNAKKPKFPAIAKSRKTGGIVEVVRDGHSGKIKNNDVQVVTSISDLKNILQKEIFDRSQICSIHFFKKDGTMTVLTGRLRPTTTATPFDNTAEATPTPFKPGKKGELFESTDLQLLKSLSEKIKSGEMTKEQAVAASQRSPYLLGIRHIRVGGKTYVVKLNPQEASVGHFDTPPVENPYIRALTDTAEKGSQFYKSPKKEGETAPIPEVSTTANNGETMKTSSIINKSFERALSKVAALPAQAEPQAPAEASEIPAAQPVKSEPVKNVQPQSKASTSDKKTAFKSKLQQDFDSMLQALRLIKEKADSEVAQRGSPSVDQIGNLADDAFKRMQSLYNQAFYAAP
jgi:hypothetical protein